MPRELWDYQARAVRAVVDAGAEVRSVCLVAPTGSGKTRMGTEFVARALRRGNRVLWLCHRDELRSQAAASIADEVGGHLVQLYDGEHPAAPVAVATVQSLLGGGGVHEPHLIIADEAHHYASDEWGAVLARYPGSALLGLTATPARSDGRPLAQFARMVVAANYSELIQRQRIVPCRVQVPTLALESGQVALPALEAYQRHGEGRSGFLFAESIDAAEAHAAAFRAAGIPSVAVSERTPMAERRAAIQGLRDGVFRILTNVYTLTEGVDVPTASVCILARGVGHVTQYLQMVGRVLRAAPGKRDALLLDLSGAAMVHGSPTADRDYSLGEGIMPADRSPGLRQCEACGLCWDTGERACPRCGWEPALTAEAAAKMVIAGCALRDVTAELEAYQVKRKVLRELRIRQRAAGYALYWVVKRYRELTGDEECVITDADMDEKEAEMVRLQRVAVERGLNPGWCAHRYREMFGVWPRKRRNSDE